MIWRIARRRPAPVSASPAPSRHRRLIGEASVLQNVMIGGTIDGTATFAESLLCSAAPPP